MLHADPVIGCEFLYRPITIETSKARVFLSAKRRMRLIVHWNIVHMSHARFNLASKASTSLKVCREYRAGQSVLAVISQFKRVSFISSSLNPDQGAKNLLFGNFHFTGDIDKDVWGKNLAYRFATTNQ
ncbi:hypothetical protein D3C71_1446950 [compost metagenome]